MRRNFILMVLTLLLSVSLLAASGCGEKPGSISRDVHSQIKNGMTMDDVDAIAGQPERSHSLGSADNPQIFWYYNKTDGEGFVRVVFENGKVTTVSPYDEDFTP
jgi:hypothetical protein